MQSTLKPRDSDPHDDFVIAPEIVPATWADKVLADITRDAKNSADIEKPASDRSSAAASGVAAPTVDTTFRATATDDVPVPAEPPSTSQWAKRAFMLVFALCSAAAAAAWHHHGDAAKQMISSFVPNFVITSSPPAKASALPGETDTPAAQVSVAEQTPAPPAAPAQPAETVAAAATAPSPDTAQLESMARDLAAMAQQVEQLKASIAELKTSQQAMVRDIARTSEIKPAAPNPRPRTAAPPPRTAAAPPQRPLPAYPPAPAAAQPAPPPMSTPSAPPPQAATRTDDDEPIVRPPMPLR